MPKQQVTAKQNTAIKRLEKNLKTIEEFEANFILQKAKLKKSAANYGKAKKLIQTCKKDIDKYTNLIDAIDDDVTGNNSREREARKILSARKKDLVNYKDRLGELKENRKSELYGREFTKMFKKSDLKFYKDQLKTRIENFDLLKANDLNMSAERFIAQDLTTSEKIITQALEDAPKIKISTDKFEKLSKILAQEINDLTLAYKDMKAKQSDSQSMAGWVLKWVAEKAAGGAVTALAGYITTQYIIPAIVPALYKYIASYTSD